MLKVRWVMLCCITNRPWVFVDGQASTPFLSPLFTEPGLCTHWRQAAECKMGSHSCVLGTRPSTEGPVLSESLQLHASSFLFTWNTALFPISSSCLQTFLVLSSLQLSFSYNFLNTLNSSMVGHSLPYIMLNYARVRFNHSSLKSLGWFQNTQDILFHPGKQNATEGLWVLGGGTWWGRAEVSSGMRKSLSCHRLPINAQWVREAFFFPPQSRHSHRNSLITR